MFFKYIYTSWNNDCFMIRVSTNIKYYYVYVFLYSHTVYNHKCTSQLKLIIIKYWFKKIYLH